MSNTIKIFTVDRVRHIRIERVVQVKPQRGWLMLMPGEQVFRISIAPLKMESVKFNTDLRAAIETIECRPGFVYVVSKSKEQAVRRFTNNISNEHAVKIAEQNGCEDLNLVFPDDEKGQEPHSGPDLFVN